MSNFHFFTDRFHNGNPITTQNSGDTFGGIDNMNDRVCSLIDL